MSKAKYIELYRKHANLSQREKLIILFSSIGLILFLGFILLIEPNWKQISDQQRNIDRTNNRIANTKAQIAQLQERLSRDPNESLRRQLATLGERENTIEQKLALQTTDLVSAEQMTEVLSELLRSADGIQLLEVSSLPPEVISLNHESTTENPAERPDSAISLYQHGVKLVLSGRYFDIYQYLETIETQPWQLYWRKFAYQVKEYPMAELTIELYTLSTSEAFINV